jgi:hypothetical protein
MLPQSRNAVLILLAAAFAIAGAYCAFWIFASADMAFIPCDNAYSLFSPIPRCRTPYIAMILSGIFFLLMSGVLVIRHRMRKRTTVL